MLACIFIYTLWAMQLTAYWFHQRGTEIKLYIVYCYVIHQNNWKWLYFTQHMFLKENNLKIFWKSCFGEKKLILLFWDIPQWPIRNLKICRYVFIICIKKQSFRILTRVLVLKIQSSEYWTFEFLAKIIFISLQKATIFKL